MMDINKIAERLYLRFTLIWGDKHTSRFTDKKFIQIWVEDWSDGIGRFNPMILKEAIDYCKLNLDWPPSLAEFIKICERSLNIPDPSQCMHNAIRGDLTDPFVKLIYDKIGSWNVKHDSEKELINKFKYHHEIEMNNIRVNEKLRNNKLMSFKEEYDDVEMISNVN